MEKVNYNDFQVNLKYWLDTVGNNANGVMIKRKGIKDLVLILLDEYNSLKETIYLFTGTNRDVMLNSVDELESGLGTQKNILE